MSSDKVRSGNAEVEYSWHQIDGGKWAQRQARGIINTTTNILRLVDDQFDTETECKAALKSQAELWARAKG